MKKVGFWGVAACFALCVLSSHGYGQILMNEVSVNPAGNDDGCEYIELLGPPGGSASNVQFLSLEGDTNKGQATFVITIGSPGPVFGSNGLLVFTGTIAPCNARTFPAGTTRIQLTAMDTATGVLQNGSNSFMIVNSATAIAPGTDLDTNDDGTLESLPAGATILDGVAWTDGGATDVIYGTQLTAIGGTIGAATRFPGDTRANNAGAWYAGALTGTPDATTYSATIRTANFPANGALTPGAPNVGSVVRDAPVDMNGDGKTDWVVARAAGGSGTQVSWYTQFNGGNPAPVQPWGISGDDLLAADYDGDGSDDITVYRPSNNTFYIINSSTQTFRVDQFGAPGDDAKIIGDYDGDGRDDIAVYRPGAQSVWYYRPSGTPATAFVSVPWGEAADYLSPGDYDGDGRADFVVQRGQGGVGHFYIRYATGSFAEVFFGLDTDQVIPGDYDGDGKTDIAVVRPSSGSLVWDFEPSGTPGVTTVSDTWGIPTDVVVQGDYTGDGKTDYAIWREGIFYVMTVGDRNIFTKPWGAPDDAPIAAYNTF